jgi:hypothetical protein
VLSIFLNVEWRDKEVYGGTKKFTPCKPLKISRWNFRGTQIQALLISLVGQF